MYLTLSQVDMGQEVRVNLYAQNKSLYFEIITPLTRYTYGVICGETTTLAEAMNWLLARTAAWFPFVGAENPELDAYIFHQLMSIVVPDGLLTLQRLECRPKQAELPTRNLPGKKRKR